MKRTNEIRRRNESAGERESVIIIRAGIYVGEEKVYSTTHFIFFHSLHLMSVLCMMLAPRDAMGQQENARRPRKHALVTHRKQPFLLLSGNQW